MIKKVMAKGWYGRRRRRSTWTGRRVAGPGIGVVVVTLMLGVMPAAAGTTPAATTGGTGHGDGHLVVQAPRETERGSVLLTGRTFARSEVRVAGGILPASAFTGQDGTFSTEVLLRPNRRNRLVVTAFSATQRATARLVVCQRLNKPVGRLAGRVLDVTTGTPVAGATVSYGLQRAETDTDGRYTLTGLPEGGVAVSARAAGRLSGLTVARIEGGRGQTRDLLVQPLAAPVRVGPGGAAFSGPGWRVEVPPGAVRSPTDLNVTSLAFTGPVDMFGAPFVDLSPTGLRFARPVTVAVDPTVIGLDPARTGVVSVDPSGPTARRLPSKRVGHELVVALTALHGEEVRVEPEPGPLNQWGGIDAFCTPFASAADADRAVAWLRATLLPFLGAVMGPTSEGLWGEFLAGGIPSASRVPVTESQALYDFLHDLPAEKALSTLIDDLERKVGESRPSLSAPENPTTRDLASFGLGAHVDINYSWIFDVPGNIAGDVGATLLPSGLVPDDRTFSGPVQFVPTADERGVLTHVDLVADLTLTVQDGVDLCPGDPGAAGIETHATIPLSRLQVTPLPGGGGTYAKAVLFEAAPKVNPVRRDITSLYDNDPDGDGYPDRQPWAGGSFTLDNCPGLANSDQADRDGDGAGDACDPDTPPPPDDGGLPPGGVPPGPGGPPDGGTGPDTGPHDPGPGGSYGDPHVITYDSGSFPFHGAGDYVLAESTTDDFAVQARYQRLRLPDGPTSASYNRGVAARVGTSVIAFGDDATSHRHDPQVASLDGQPLALNPGRTDLPGGAVLTVTSTRGAVVTWPDGTELAAGRWVGDNAFLTLAPSRWGHVHGLLGDADRDPANDLAARDGTVVPDPYDPAFYPVFGASWRVTGTASFFRSVLPPDGVLPVDPPDIASVSQLSDAARAAAEQTCRDKGLRPGAGLEQCILDVGLSGDPSFADDETVVAERLRQSVDLGALGGPVEDTAEIRLGQRVAGSIGSPFATDVYRIDLQAGDTVRISTPGPCPGAGDGTFSITLVAPSGRPIGRTRGAGCGSMGATELRESGRYQVRVFDSGGLTGGYELQLDGAPLGLTCQANEVAPNDDGSGPEVALPFTLDFRGRRFTSVWVNNNGNVTFDGPLSTFTPEPFATIASPIVAAWFADVDTRGAASQPVRFGFGSVGGRRAFCVDYDRVGYFDQHDDLLNSFQLFLVDRSDVADGAFDIVFAYRQLRWETGDFSGGTGGLGGTSAGVGYSNGTGQPGTFLEVNGSRQPGSLLDSSPTGLSRTSTNSDQAGVHVFPVRSG